MRSINLFGSKLRNIRPHLANKLISNNRIAQRPHEQSRALDLDTILDLQQRLVSFEVGLAVAVVVACIMLAYDLYSLVRSFPAVIGERTHKVQQDRVSSTLPHRSQVRPH
jgi:hypothetical protein